MNEKVKVVVFGKNGARIFINPDPSVYRGTKHLIDPNLDGVQGLPPHLWALSDGKVVANLDGKLPPEPVQLEVSSDESELVAPNQMEPVVLVKAQVASKINLKKVGAVGLNLLVNAAIAYLIHKCL